MKRKTSSMKSMVRLISYSFSLFALHTVTCFVSRVTWRDSHTALQPAVSGPAPPTLMSFFIMATLETINKSTGEPSQICQHWRKRKENWRLSRKMLYKLFNLLCKEMLIFMIFKFIDINICQVSYFLVIACYNHFWVSVIYLIVLLICSNLPPS